MRLPRRNQKPVEPLNILELERIYRIKRRNLAEAETPFYLNRDFWFLNCLTRSILGARIDGVDKIRQDSSALRLTPCA